MPITRTKTGLRRSPRLTSTRRKQQKKSSKPQRKASKARRPQRKASKARKPQRKVSKNRKTPKVRRPSVSKASYTKEVLSALFQKDQKHKHRTKCIHWRKTGITPGSTLSVKSRCRARSPMYLNYSRSRKCPGKWQYLTRDGKLTGCYKGKGPHVRRRASSK